MVRSFGRVIFAGGPPRTLHKPVEAGNSLREKLIIPVEKLFSGSLEALPEHLRDFVSKLKGKIDECITNPGRVKPYIKNTSIFPYLFWERRGREGPLRQMLYGIYPREIWICGLAY